MHHDFFEKTMPFLRVFPSLFGSPFPRSINGPTFFMNPNQNGITDRIRKVLKLAYKGGMSSITRSTPRIWPNIQLGDLTVFGNGSFPVKRHKMEAAVFWGLGQCGHVYVTICFAMFGFV